MNYYRRYVGDYQRKTMRLDPTDHGVYDLMLDYYYAEEQPLPLELDDIHAICKAIKPEHRKAVAKVLKLYFDQHEDGYHNKRADEEIALSQRARTNGRGHTGKGTQTATEGGTDTGTQNTTQTITEEGGETVHPPSTILQPPTFNHQKKLPAASVSLSAEGAWDGITGKQIDLWRLAYPAVNVETELAAAASWLLANPANRKSNYARFLNGWLNRAQDRAPRVASTGKRFVA